MLGKYVIWFLVKTAFAVNCAVMGLFFVLTLLDNFSGSSLAGLRSSVLDTLLHMPEILHLTMPASCAVGAAVGLALLDGRSEIALLRLAGASLRRLVCWVGTAGLMWALVHVLIGEVLLPRSAQTELKLRAAKEGSLITAGDAVWLRTKDGYAGIGSIALDGRQLSDVQIFTSRNGSLAEVTLAERASFAAGAWRLDGAVTAQLGDEHWQFSELDRLAWPAGPRPEFLVSFQLEPSAQPLHRLAELAAELRSFGQSAVSIELVIWSRVADSLSLIVLMVCALALVRNRTRYSIRHARNSGIIALLAMLLYYYASVIIRQFAVTGGLPVAAGALLPPLAFVALILAWAAYRRRAS